MAERALLRSREAESEVWTVDRGVSRLGRGADGDISCASGTQYRKIGRAGGGGLVCRSFPFGRWRHPIGGPFRLRPFLFDASALG